MQKAFYSPRSAASPQVVSIVRIYLIWLNIRKPLTVPFFSRVPGFRYFTNQWHCFLRCSTSHLWRNFESSENKARFTTSVQIPINFRLCLERMSLSLFKPEKKSMNEISNAKVFSRMFCSQSPSWPPRPTLRRQSGVWQAGMIGKEIGWTLWVWGTRSAAKPCLSWAEEFPILFLLSRRGTGEKSSSNFCFSHWNATERQKGASQHERTFSHAFTETLQNHILRTLRSCTWFCQHTWECLQIHPFAFPTFRFPPFFPILEHLWAEQYVCLTIGFAKWWPSSQQFIHSRIHPTREFIHPQKFRERYRNQKLVKPRAEDPPIRKEETLDRHNLTESPPAPFSDSLATFLGAPLCSPLHKKRPPLSPRWIEAITRLCRGTFLVFLWQ